MFSIDRVELTNFRSYTGNHTFVTPIESGLYNLTGRNLLNPALGANAAGKSTLLDAIYWCLYGKTTRGLKAGDVVSWGEKGCTVSVHLDVGGLKWVVSRNQNPNYLTWAEGGLTHNLDQATLERYLRLSPEAFLYSVILPQFGESFFDLAPAAKLALFSQIMELDYWLERSRMADELARDLDGQKAKCELALAKAEGQQETIKGDVTALCEKEANFAVQQAKNLKWMKQELQLRADTIKGVEAEGKDYKNALVGIEEKIAKLASQSFCPTCEQSIPNNDLKSLHRNKADFEGKLGKLKWQYKSLKERFEEMRAIMAEETKRTNPYSEMIAEKNSTLAKLRGHSNSLKDAVTKLNEGHAAVSFWVGGFKRVRLFIVEEALRQLEIEVNNNLASLGLMDWRVEFDVERENKNGGITKGFVVLITPPGAEQPLRYESYSGGETQRLRLAGDLGLANLIMERAGLANTIEFYDEPSQHLSQEGLLDLAETLSQRAETQGKRIFLVDHNIIDFSGFAGTYTVTKDENGSHLAKNG